MDDQPETRATLRVLTGTRKGQVFELEGQVIRVGFSAEDGNDIGLNDQYVSRFHGRIEATDEGWVFIDQESRNGSSIVLADGTKQALEPEKPRLLISDDVLELGDTRLRFEIR
jgi:pSer/pThr/pTyr-binding forkhead associated (FHA) protein